MPEPTRPSIFNKKAADKLRSPDDLDRYIRITGTSVWTVVGAVAALLVGLLCWGVFGTVTTSISTIGVCRDGACVCFLSADEVVKVRPGDRAVVDGQQMAVAEVAEVPLSAQEAHELLGSDYLVQALLEGQWGYEVRFEGEGSFKEDVPLETAITTERIAPISLILG